MFDLEVQDEIDIEEQESSHIFKLEKDASDFKPHIIKRSEDRTLQCKLTFEGNVSLKVHIRKHTQGRRYHCKICNKTYFSFWDLSQHVNSHSDNRPYVCKKSKSQKPIKLQPDINIKEQIKIASTESFLNLENMLIPDWLFYRIEDQYSDDSRHMFDVELREVVGIEEHKLSHMVELKNVASDATLIFSVEDNLEKNGKMQILNTNATEELEGYKRNACAETFVLVGDFKAHIIKRLEDKLLQCVICGLKLQGNVLLTIHILNHTQQRQYHCKICNKSFSCSSMLSTHLKTHSENRAFECNICHLSFKRKDHLITHQNKHSKQKQFVCKICQQQFLYASTLGHHLKTHSDDRPHACEFCSLTFKSKAILNIHRNKHAKQSQYTCNICNKTFLYSSSLWEHMKTHSDNRPFQCTICNASFKANSKLTRHSKIVHKTSDEG
ncbi:hypothetical protein HUJ05_004999, partial [Dendroctonus ponderosae]